jgi:glutamate racemase
MKRIGFFDSGIGGLSVLRHAPQRLGDAEYIYVADSAYAPYGARAETLVRERSLEISAFLHQQRVDAIVMACNTATALAAEAVRAAAKVPVIAMEPALKPAMQASRNKRVVVLATESTLNSARYRALKASHALQGEVIERACHHWVEALEQGRLEARQLGCLVADELRDIQSSHADTYILACTHFPFLREQIARCLTRGEHIVDPAPAVIEQLARRLELPLPPVEVHGQPRLSVFSSGPTVHTQRRIRELLGWDPPVASLQF